MLFTSFNFLQKKALSKIQLVKSVLFLLIGCILLGFLQNILTPRYDTPNFYENITRKIEDFYNSDIKYDVVFLGTSHIQQGVSPMEIYNSTQILSYNMGTSSQPMAVSWCELNDILEEKPPKVIVLDASGLFFDSTRDPAWRYVLDSKPFSLRKINYAKEYEKNVGKKNAAYSAIFPIIKYHDRWKELNYSDFASGFHSDQSLTKGYVMRSTVGEETVSKEEMNEIDIYLSRDIYHRWVVNNDTEEVNEWHLAVNNISDENREYLMKMHDKCSEQGVSLLVTKVPVINDPTKYLSVWTYRKYMLVKELCFDLGIDYYDMLYESDMIIDPSTDSADGLHANIRGTIKISDNLINKLIDLYELEPVNNENYNQLLESYLKLQEIALVESEYNIANYIERICNYSGNTVIVMSVNEEGIKGFTEETIQKLMQQGIRTNLNHINKEAYLAILDEDCFQYEVYSNRVALYSYEDDRGNIFEISSSGYYTNPRASIVINGVEYARNLKGINIVVFDKDIGTVIDSVVIDTKGAELNISRANEDIHNFFVSCEERLTIK